MRIARALALAGIDSRRKCEQHILNGAVQVNGEVARDLGRQVDPENDVLMFHSRPVFFPQHTYYILNKPKGYITSAGDPHANKTVYDLLPSKLVRSTRQSGPSRQRVFPVGRLDKDTMGLLLFTNDGDLANKLIHPRYQIGKWYEARLDRAFDARDKRHLLEGVRLREGLARMQRVKVLSPRTVHILICEGKKREVRRVFEKVGYEVVRLIRFGFGPLSLAGLALGEGRFLKKKEIEELRKMTSGENSSMHSL